MEDKKIEERIILEKFKKASNLGFAILDIQEAQKVFPLYTGENPDFIIHLNDNYIGIDLFMLCLTKSTPPINYGGEEYTNQMQKKKEHPNRFNSLEELAENIKQRKEHQEDYPLTRQDDSFIILKERLLQKAGKVKNYVTPKNWLLGFADQSFNMNLVRDIYEDKATQGYQNLIKNIVKNIKSIDRVILFETGTGSIDETGTELKDKIFEYKNV